MKKDIVTIAKVPCKSVAKLLLEPSAGFVLVAWLVKPSLELT
jgi:hypothetical protein